MTIIQTLSDADFGDNLMSVLANDDFATVGTRLIFDFENPKCWAGGDPAAASLVKNLANWPTVTGGFNSTARPVFLDGAMVFAGAVTNGDAMDIRKSDAIGLPFFPSGDGEFNDTLLIAWIKTAAAPASNAGVVGIGRTSAGYVGMGFLQAPTGAILEQLSSQVVSQAEAGIIQVAAHYAYDLTANTTTVKRFKNGVLVGTAAGSAPDSLIVDGNSKALIGGFAGASNGFNGSIHRVILEHTSISVLDPAELVAKDWDANHVRFGI